MLGKKHLYQTICILFTLYIVYIWVQQSALHLNSHEVMVMIASIYIKKLRTKATLFFKVVKLVCPKQTFTGFITTACLYVAIATKSDAFFLYHSSFGNGLQRCTLR